MYVPEITQVKNHLETLKTNALLEAWELPYENILTRRSAAIFFVTPAPAADVSRIWTELQQYDSFSYRVNTEKRLSQLTYRVTFNKEELENQQNAQ